MDGGASALLPRSIGSRRTLELVYTNRVFSATDAHAWGFVNWVVPDGELGPRSTVLAEQLARGPTRAFGLTKGLVLDGWSESPEAHLEQEAMALVTAIRTQDASEGLTAFREHREPNFTGS
jgi:2-(1,2-epoxy-1,2-dihydrophenyl)acetyl-CoA isomerase